MKHNGKLLLTVAFLTSFTLLGAAVNVADVNIADVNVTEKAKEAVEKNVPSEVSDKLKKCGAGKCGAGKCGGTKAAEKIKDIVK